MVEQSIRAWNPWWTDAAILGSMSGMEREMFEFVRASLETKFIKAIIGPRRAGKTTFLYQIINDLIGNGLEPEKILFLNFDDNNIFNIELDELMETCLKVSPGITHIFLDEVQSKKGWERWVRTSYDKNRFDQIFVTGSSSSLLKEEVSDVLAGRHMTFTVLPFSFKEFFNYMNSQDKDEIDPLKMKARYLHYLDKYILNGGYPETFGLKEPYLTSYLNELFDDTLARDVSARYGADFEIARKLGYFIHSNISKVHSLRSMSRNLGISPDTVSKYLIYLKNCYIVHFNDLFSFKVKEQMSYSKKFYAIDPGMARSVSFRFSDDRGRVFENLVMMELVRRAKLETGVKIFYHRTSTNKEIDFLVFEKDRVRELIQVCVDLEDQKTRRREEEALIDAMKEFDLNRGIIITENDESSGGVDDIMIVRKPIWKWLLEDWR
jgi:hypothetical protein